MFFLNHFLNLSINIIYILNKNINLMYKMAQIIKKKQYKISKSPKEHTLKGGGLKSNTLQLLLEATYTGNEVDGYFR